MKNLKKHALIMFLVAPLLLFIPKNFAYEPTALEKLQALLIIKQIQSIIYVLEQQITKTQDYATNVSKAGGLRDKLKKAQEEIDKLKNDKDLFKDQETIKDLEDRIITLRIQLNELAVHVYAKAVPEKGKYKGQNLYKIVDQKVKDIRNDTNIREQRENIVKLQRKLADDMREKVDVVQRLGLEIKDVIKPKEKAEASLQVQLAGIKASLSTVEQQLNKKITEVKVDKKLDPLLRKRHDIRENMEKEVAKLSTARRNKIRLYENAVNALDLMLEYIRNPDKIIRTTEEEVAGLVEVRTYKPL